MEHLVKLISALETWISHRIPWASDFPYKIPILIFILISVGVGIITSLWIIKNSIVQALSPTEKINKAEALSRNGEYAKAKELFISVKAYARAARMALRENLLEETAQLAAKGNDPLLLAQTLSQLGRQAEAAATYEQIGKQTEAAEIWEKLGEFEKALDRYRRVENIGKIEQLLMRLGKWDELGELCTKEFIKSSSHAGTNPAPHVLERTKNWAARAGDAFMKAGAHGRASDIFLQAGMYVNAAQCMEKAENYVRASDLYQQANRLEDAARMLIQAGRYELAADIYEEMRKPEEVPRLLEKAGKISEARVFDAKLALGRGELRNAALLFMEGHEYREAAPLFEECGDRKDAARAWSAAGMHGEAADLFKEEGEHLLAANEYKLATNFEKAADCFAKAGEAEQAIQNYDAAGKFFQAGQLLEAKNTDRAIAFYQKVSRKDVDSWKADHALGRIFWKKGLSELAEEKLSKLCEHLPIEPENLELFYDYASFLETRGQRDKANDIYGKILAIDFHYKDVLARKKAGGRSKEKEEKTSFEDKQRKSGSRKKHNPIFIPRAGVIICDRYELIEKIASGASGMVFLAKDRKLGRPLAIKLIPPSSRASIGGPKIKEDDDRFLREARMIAQLSHPHIVTIFDAGIEHDYYFLAIEHIDGPNLRDYLRSNHPVPIRTVLEFGRDITDALTYAHQRKIVHRDIKPANLLVSKGDVIKMADFGLARVLLGPDMTATQNIGSPIYMAPELIRGERFDHRVDLYSLGILLYELLAGEPPFKEGEVTYHHLHTLPRPLSDLRSNLAVELETLVMKLLEKDPRDRVATASEVKGTLEAILR